jgi:hypothetical protein
MRKKILVIGGGAAMLLLGMLFGAFFAGPLLASAHSTTPSTTATTSTATTNLYCQQYLQDLAQRLNVPVSTLEQDQKAAKGDILAQLVKDGKLTLGQANAIKQRLESQQACNGKGNAWWDRGILRQTFKQYEPTLLDEVASGLHLNASQLQSDLQNGQTLVQIAKAQHVSESQLHTITLNAVQSALTQAEKAGTITQSQESAFMTALQKHPGVVNRWLNHTFTKK